MPFNCNHYLNLENLTLTLKDKGLAFMLQHLYFPSPLLCLMDLNIRSLAPTLQLSHGQLMVEMEIIRSIPDSMSLTFILRIF